MIYLLYFFIIALSINLIMFIPAYFFKTDKLTDLSYSITFILLSIISLFLSSFSFRNIILSLMVILWGLRLGSFLFIRINYSKKDKRFDGIRESFKKFLKFWSLQGVSVWIILIPFFLFMRTESNSVFWVGLFVWLIGLLIESVADIQKFLFSLKDKNKGEFIKSGIWKYSRHPNYFGEILCWFGIYLFVFPSLNLIQLLIGLISPIYISSLLIFFTGIPKLEEYADKKWGDRDDYQEYKENTNKLIPWF